MKITKKKITKKMIRAAYKYSKEIYDGQISKKEAIKDLVADCGMNRSSAEGYINSFKKMMAGEKYQRTLNEKATGYFFTQISIDYGSSKLGNAIKATKKHVEYYERLGNGNLNAIRKVISDYETNL